MAESVTLSFDPRTFSDYGNSSECSVWQFQLSQLDKYLKLN